MKVLVADDHEVFRQGLKIVLEELGPAIDLLEAKDFGEALRTAQSDPALDLVLLDLRMPEMDGFEGLKALRRLLPRVPIVIMSASEESSDVFQALECGASGYLPKSAARTAMVDALRRVLVGGVCLPSDILAGNRAAKRQEPAGDPTALTPRQLSVLRLIADGLSNKEIAYRIGLSEGTVKTHITAIMRTLGVRNRVQMLLAAERHGIRPQRVD